MFLSILVAVILALLGGCMAAEGDLCTDKHTNTVGRCTLASKCQSANEDLHKNNVRPTFCEYTFTSILVCCRDGTTILQTPSPIQTTKPPKQQKPRPQHQDTIPQQTNSGVNTGPSSGLSARKCQEYNKGVVQTVAYIPLVTDPEELIASAAKCDYVGTELVIGGEDAKLGEFPHMAAIGFATFDGSYTFDCGGSLISHNFVLTAGHCTYSPSSNNPVPVVVRLGEHNIDPTVKDGANPIDVNIRNIHKHPAYKPPVRYNDIALLELASDVQFDAYIRPACLWTDNDFGSNIKALATGWGITDPDTGERAKVLQKVSLSILANDHCNRTLKSIINRKWKNGFHDTQMCAGELRAGKDTCQGDSGSPLQIVSDTNQCIFNIIGLTSFGPSLCGHQPAVYTRVSSYVSWIESKVWPGEK